jgi:DMSO/TMAO reductase YedYZ molybdopterin-dependent catalytic subunit
VKQETQAILQTIRSLPEHTITATLRSPRGSSTRTYKGAMLYDYARAAGRMPTRPSLGFGNHYFVVSAEDGFRISLAYFEVTPRATDKQVLLAYEQDGEPLRAGVRLIVPGDDLGGRSIAGVVAVELRSVSSMALQEARPSSTSIALGGILKRPASLSLDDLTRFQAHEIETMPTPRHGGIVVGPRSYTGPLLWDLLEDAGPVVDSTINEDILRKAVVVHSTDGHSAVIATGEIDPRFMAGQVIVATECAGEALADAEGHFRLVVPFDKLVGRTLKSVRSIELVEA